MTAENDEKIRRGKKIKRELLIWEKMNSFFFGGGGEVEWCGRDNMPSNRNNKVYVLP